MTVFLVNSYIILRKLAQILFFTSSKIIYNFVIFAATKLFLDPRHAESRPAPVSIEQSIVADPNPGYETRCLNDPGS
jgi:hypothetical protein